MALTEDKQPEPNQPKSIFQASGYPNTEDSYTFSFDDKESLVSLSHEYKDKLISLCQKISDIYGKIIIYQVLIWFLGLIIIFPSLYFFKSIQITLFAVVVFNSFVVCIITIGWRERKILRLTKNEARRIAIRLEKVVRLGYQIQENLGFHLITEIELDFALADAESALEYYYELIKKEKNLTDFHPFKTEVKNTP